MKQKVFVFLSVLLVIASCSSNKTVTRMLNNKYSNINVKDVCNCNIEEEVKHVRRYKPPISLLLDYTEFEASSNWLLENNGDDYKKIYFVNASGNNGMLDMSLISKQPIKLTHKNKALTFNFTPCIYKNNYYKLPKFGIQQKRRNKRDENKDFDYSAFSYFNYLAAGTNMREGINLETLLSEILEEQYFYFDDSDSVYEYQLHIKEINKKYGVSIKEYNHLHIENEVNPIEHFVEELVKAKIDISNFIVNEYVLTENTKHKINKKEKQQLKIIFSNHDNFLFEKIDFSLKNKLYRSFILGGNGSRSENKIGIEINTDIIRKWDVTSQKPLLDSVGKALNTDIILYQSGFLKISNYETNEMDIDSLCATTSEITKTGILLDFNNAKVLFAKDVAFNTPRYSLNVKYYPFFKKKNNPPEKMRNYDKTKYYDSTLTNFSGLLIPQSNIQIPINDIMLAVKGKNIIVNNLFISGIFEIKLQSTGNTKQHLKLVSNNSSIEISEKDLLAHFKELGLKHVELKKDEDVLKVFFKQN